MSVQKHDTRIRVQLDVTPVRYRGSSGGPSPVRPFIVGTIHQVLCRNAAVEEIVMSCRGGFKLLVTVFPPVGESTDLRGLQERLVKQVEDALLDHAEMAR